VNIPTGWLSILLWLLLFPAALIQNASNSITAHVKHHYHFSKFGIATVAHYAVCISMFQKLVAGRFPMLTESLINSMR
jgi:hypothetical protein